MDGGQPETRCVNLYLILPDMGLELRFVIGLDEHGNPKTGGKALGQQALDEGDRFFDACILSISN